jgi:hypothetical protein
MQCEFEWVHSYQFLVMITSIYDKYIFIMWHNLFSMKHFYVASFWGGTATSCKLISYTFSHCRIRIIVNWTIVHCSTTEQSDLTWIWHRHPFLQINTFPYFTVDPEIHEWDRGVYIPSSPQTNRQVIRSLCNHCEIHSDVHTITAL